MARRILHEARHLNPQNDEQKAEQCQRASAEVLILPQLSREHSNREIVLGRGRVEHGRSSHRVWWSVGHNRR